MAENATVVFDNFNSTEIPSTTAVIFPEEEIICPSFSSVNLIVLGVLHVITGIAGSIANISLIILLYRTDLLHQPTYFLIVQICLGDLLICLLVTPLTVMTLYFDQDHRESRPVPPQLPGLFTVTLILWIILLLLVLAVYRLRVVGRESVDETRLTTCAGYGLLSLIIAGLIALQHLFDFSTFSELRKVNDRFLPDFVAFSLCLTAVIGCYFGVAKKCHRGSLRIVRHGRFFQNEFAQRKAWLLNRSLMIMSGFYFGMFLPSILWSLVGAEVKGEICVVGWITGLPGLLVCGATLFPVWLVACHRRDIRRDVLGCLWRTGQREEVAVDRAVSGVRCIAFRSDLTEFA